MDSRAKRLRIFRGLSAVFGIFGLPGSAFADTGLALMVTLPLLLVVLTPIVLVEAFVFARRLHLAYGLSLKAMAAANSISTLLGVPIAWGFVWAGLSVANAAGTHSPPIAALLRVIFSWDPDDAHTAWILPVATLVLMVPFFCASWILEFHVACWFFPKSPQDYSTTRGDIRRAVMYANAASYAGLVILGDAWIFYTATIAGAF